jgi:predicted PurR-regulated permease PerM
MRLGRHVNALVSLATFTLIVVALYFGKPVLMPVALATLLSFLLSPIVNQLVRLGLSRTVAVIALVLLIFSGLGATIWGVASQMSILVDELPKYKDNIREKVVDLRGAGKGSFLQRIQETWREIKGELKKADAPQSHEVATANERIASETPPSNAPVPVVVQGQTSSAAWQLPSAIGPLLEVLVGTGLVIVLVIFMLLRKRDLRNRVVVLFGYSRMPTTTLALDEAAERISRYLLMQTTINGSYGLAVGIGLYFLGLPYALLWGGMAALLRFIPYVGAWMGAAMPILLSLAVFPGWLHPFIVLGLILFLELMMNMFMEPLLYGHSIGVSEVALLIAVAFWTWIWGGIGLALATPLTVCLVVLAKYVPGLSFLQLLLSDEPVMDPARLYYQRLLAMDKAEAEEIVAEFAEKHELIEVYNDLLIPALVSAKQDFKSQNLTAEHLNFIVATTDGLLSKIEAMKPLESEPQAEPSAPREILCVPIDDEVDELALTMLCKVLPDWIEVERLSSKALTGEVAEKAEAVRPSVICLVSIAPGGSAELRLLGKKLTGIAPALNVVIARYGLKSSRKIQELAISTGIQSIATTLAGTRNLILQLSDVKPELAVQSAPMRMRDPLPEPSHN